MILPSPSPGTRPYWDAANEGRFLLKRCAACRRWRHPREMSCCPGAPLEWAEASGRGTLLSYTVVRLALNPGLAAQVPYTVTLTRTEEGPHFVTSLPADGHRLTTGVPMTVAFDRVAPDVNLPRFRPAGDSTHE